VIAERSEQIGSLPVRGGWEGGAFNSLFACSIIRWAVSLLRESEAAGKARDYIKPSGRHRNRRRLCGVGFKPESVQPRQLRFGQRRVLGEIAPDALEYGLGHAVLVGLVVEARFLLGIGDEGRLDQDRGNVGRL